MSDFYAIRNNALKRDMNLIKKLELKQRQLEDKVFNSKKTEEKRKFTDHPKRILSDSDTTGSNTPRVVNNFSSSTSNIDKGQYEFHIRKQRAQDLHKKLHQKLSIIDSNPSRLSDDFSQIGDNYLVSQKSTSDRFQCRPSLPIYESSSGGSSIDLEQDFKESPRRSSEIKIKTLNRLENNYSVASKANSGGDRRSAESKLSSKLSSKSFVARGITVFVFEKKFTVLVEKCLQVIDEIRSVLTKGITPPDGEEDESRRIVRSKEFSNRFSRNYLYPLARQLKELSVAQTTMNPLIFNQKLISTYQIINNGLQAYQSHLPTSVGDCTFNQLKIVMSNVVELCGIHREQVTSEDKNYVAEFIDTFKINAELIIQKVEEYLTKPPASTDSVLKSENSKISLTKYGEGQKKPVGKAGRKKGNVDKRYSMYAVTASFRKDAPWKRAVENLAKKKFNVRSKYRTATYKHRPPLEKEPDINSIPKLKALFPKKSGMLRVTRLNTPINEDCIRTMVQVDQNGDNHLEKEEWENMEKKKDEIKNDDSTNKEEILMKLLQFTLKNHKEGVKDGDQSDISQILALVKQEPNADFLKKVLDGLNIKSDGENNKENQENQQLTLEIVTSQYSMSDGAETLREKSRRKEPKITVSGDKNARLICITDDNSIIEPHPCPEDTEIADNKLCQTDNIEPAKIIIRTSSETQTDVKCKESNAKTVAKGTQKGKNSLVKISRIKKCGRNLKPLDKKQAVNAIQYKLDFYRHCKNNPMYKRSTTCQPWVLMGKIAEELLNECLLAVAREIEVNDIVERVYQSELQI